jgi:hypothetical protein
MRVAFREVRRTIMREISRPEWSAFFDVFSQQHLNWRVTLEVLSRECGARVEAEDAAFEGISIGLPESRDGTILVMVGGALDRHLTHEIREPKRVMLDHSGLVQRHGETIVIISEGGPTTLVRVESPVLPQKLDRPA